MIRKTNRSKNDRDGPAGGNRNDRKEDDRKKNERKNENGFY